ncbi:MAG: CDP-glycerol glycerophosphotransferase family protein [Clostridia bacterium]|nr:CDP-glycerol glycerophosphotransferase family protein [Clostridia bacterium]
MMNIKKKLKEMYYNLPIKFLLKNYILLDSNPVMCDNAYYVYKELIARKINEKYKLIWFIKDDTELRVVEDKNVIFVSRQRKWKILYYNFFAKYILDCNWFIPKVNKYQCRIHLSHGCPVKLMDEYYKKSGKMDLIISLGDFWSEVYKKVYEKLNLLDSVEETGFPRNDTFFTEKEQINFYPNIRREKTILWLPTYRNHKALRNDAQYTGITFPLGIPCFSDINQLNELNADLRNRSILLIIKPHPAQDLNEIKKFELSNIKIIDDSYFEETTNLYNYLPLIDALITDYSSVYWDFLLADKPIGLAIPDLEEYSKHVMMPYEYKEAVIGDYLYNYEDLVSFIADISNSNDNKRVERKRIIDKYHKYQDGNSSKRVVDLLVKKMNEK